MHLVDKQNEHWRKLADVILDTFTADQSPNDMLHLRDAIAVALQQAFDQGQKVLSADK